MSKETRTQRDDRKHMKRKPRTRWKRGLAYVISKEVWVILVLSICMAFVPFRFDPERESISRLYAGSAALWAGFVFLVATLESQERVRLRRGFYIVHSGVFMLSVTQLATTLWVIFGRSIAQLATTLWVIFGKSVTQLATTLRVIFGRVALLKIVEAFVFINTLYIVLMICTFLIIFLFPERRNGATRRFLINKIEYYYAVYNAFVKEQATQQKNINTILTEYDIGYNSNLHRNSYYTPIVSEASGYVAPKQKHLHKLGEEVQKILRHSSAPRQQDAAEIKAYHCITCDKRISTDTPLLFVPRTIEDVKTIQQKLSRLLARKVKYKKIPAFTITKTYIGIMQSFQEMLLQEKSIDVFHHYAKTLQELLFRYLEYDYPNEKRDRDAENDENRLLTSFNDRSILAWYHRIATALVRSEKAEREEWTKELLDLYRKQIWHLCNQAKLPQKLLGDFLHELERRYYQAERTGQAQTELQRQIMRAYDTFLVQLCEPNQDMDAREFDKDGVEKIACQIITVHQAGILIRMYKQLDITTFEESVERFWTAPISLTHTDEFLDTAFRSIRSLRNNSRAMTKNYDEYCCLQKTVTLFKYAGYIFCNRGFSVTNPNAVDNQYLAFLINGLPTSRAEFVYLYDRLISNFAMYPSNSIFWQYPNQTEPPSHTLPKSMSDGTEEFFCWYNIHKCEPTLSLDEEEISQLFSADFRRQARGLAQRFTALIDNSDEGTLTEQQKYAVKHTVEFLHSLF